MKLVTSPRRVDLRSSHGRGKFHWLALFLVLATAMLFGVVAVSASSFILKFGTLGSGDGQFLTPRGIAVDPAGNVYVADPSGDSAGQIQKFDANGNFLARLGQNNGTAQGFLSAHRITTDSSGNVYATDGAAESASNVVKKFNSSGVFQFAFGATVPAGTTVICCGPVEISLVNVAVPFCAIFQSFGTSTAIISLEV